MQDVFLKDGTKAQLVTKTEKGYIVNPYKAYQDYESIEEYEELSGEVIMVDKVFNSAPIKVIEEEYKEVLEKVQQQYDLLQKMREELQQIESETSRLKNQKTDLSRYIINREELKTAKRLIVWPKNSIAPCIMDGTESRNFSVSYEISQYHGKERVWSHQLLREDKDSRWSSSEYFDEDYGIKVDLTDDEIFDLTIKRIEKFKNNDRNWRYILMRTSDVLLTPEYIEEKKVLMQKEKEDRLQKAEKEFKEAKENLEKIKNELTVS